MKKPYIIVVDAPDGKQATVLVNAAIDDYASKFKPNSGVINVNFADTKIMEGGVVVCTVSQRRGASGSGDGIAGS
jgi:hypothetical protein